MEPSRLSVYLFSISSLVLLLLIATAVKPTFSSLRMRDNKASFTTEQSLIRRTSEKEVSDEKPSGLDSQLAKIVETHFLRLLHLGRVPTGIEKLPSVPEYLSALFQAMKTTPMPPGSGSFSKQGDQMLWAIKAFQVDIDAAMIKTLFHFTKTSRNVDMASRIELVFETALSRPSSHRLHAGRSIIDICFSTDSCKRARNIRCHHLKGVGHEYTIYDITYYMHDWWAACTAGRPDLCMLELRIHRTSDWFDGWASSLEGNCTRDTLLVGYQTVYPDLRMTRRALRAPNSEMHRHGESREVERKRRGVVDRSELSTDGNETSYCQLYPWEVDFTELGWSWIVVPRRFSARYCAGACPSSPADLEQANLTNHAFLRTIHRNLLHNSSASLIPAPTCVPVRYQPLSILYSTNSETYELRNVNEMVAVGCGCL